MREEAELRGCNKIKALLLWIAYRGYVRECRTYLRTPKSVIPDCRQARGWDYATRLYPAGMEVT